MDESKPSQPALPRAVEEQAAEFRQRAEEAARLAESSPNAAVNQLRQASEALCRLVLLANGRELPKTPVLEVLLQDAAKLLPQEASARVRAMQPLGNLGSHAQGRPVEFGSDEIRGFVQALRVAAEGVRKQDPRLEALLPPAAAPAAQPLAQPAPAAASASADRRLRLAHKAMIGGGLALVVAGASVIAWKAALPDLSSLAAHRNAAGQVVDPLFLRRHAEANAAFDQGKRTLPSSEFNVCLEVAKERGGAVIQGGNCHRHFEAVGGLPDGLRLVSVENDPIR